MTTVLRARDHLAATIRERASERLQEANSRCDVEAAARLLVVAHHFEALDWEREEAKLLDAASARSRAGSRASRASSRREAFAAPLSEALDIGFARVPTTPAKMSAASAKKRPQR